MSTESQLYEAIEFGYLIRNGLDAVETWIRWKSTEIEDLKAGEMENVFNAADVVAFEVQLDERQLRDSGEFGQTVVVEVELQQLSEALESLKRGDVVAAYLEREVLRSSSWRL